MSPRLGGAMGVFLLCKARSFQKDEGKPTMPLDIYT